jgi:hypothetical protein
MVWAFLVEMYTGDGTFSCHPCYFHQACTQRKRLSWL